ncbi:hypothetical protein ACHAQH_008977 [Verticillium albo-atrum]
MAALTAAAPRSNATRSDLHAGRVLEDGTFARGAPTTPGTPGTPMTPVDAQLMRSAKPARSSSALDSLGFLSLIPPGAVPAADEVNIEMYFNRHPFELLIGEEFVSEMNANALLILQRDPVRVADALSAIGYAYQVGDREGSLLPVLNRRARILANLRSMKPSNFYFEEALFLLLGLCAMELVTLAQPGHHATIPTVLANVSSLISHHMSIGGEISFVSRYLLRALARQDLVVSLVHLRRPRVPTYVWLDLNDCAKADRLLGYTATLMPLLEELCILAEDLRDRILNTSRTHTREHQTLENAATSSSPLPEATSRQTCPPTSSPQSPPCTDLERPSSTTAFFPPSLDSSPFHLRAASLRHRLTAWAPPITDTLPFLTTRKFRAQAASYRAAALLYLHRLLHLPGSASPGFSSESQPMGSETDADATALHKAHDVLLYASGPPAAETKLLLWPVFLAACEMRGEEDRGAVREVLAAIAAHRGTVTVERTRRFVEERVWRARDEGAEWNWMVLAQRWPGECLPI